MVCLLMPLDGWTGLLVQLQACQTEIEKRGLLIKGTEHMWNRRQHESYPQALWAWPIPPEAVTAGMHVGSAVFEGKFKFDIPTSFNDPFECQVDERSHSVIAQNLTPL